MATVARPQGVCEASPMTATDWLQVASGLACLLIPGLIFLSWRADRALNQLKDRVSELEWTAHVQHTRLQLLERQQ